MRKRLQKLLATILAVSIMSSLFPPVPLYAEKSQVGEGSGGSYTLFAMESESDITMLYPMNVVNINENVKLSPQQIQQLMSGDIESTLPHMTHYENVNVEVGFDANQSADVKYREAVTWLSSNDKLHLPENVTFKYKPFKGDLGKTVNKGGPSKTLYTSNGELKREHPFNKGDYKFFFSTPPNKYNLGVQLIVVHNGETVIDKHMYNEVFSFEFTCEDACQVYVEVKPDKFVDNKGLVHEGSFKYNFDINQKLEYPTTRRITNVENVVDYDIKYNNIYANPTTPMDKSTYLMNLMKVVDGVQYSRPLLVNSAYTKKVNDSVSQHLTVEPLEQSVYRQYAKEAGVDFSNSQMLVDYTHFGTKLFFTTPNVKEMYISTALDKGIVKPSELNLNNGTTIELYAKYGGLTPAYDPSAPPVRANYKSDYDPLGIVSGKVVESTRLETLWRLQLIPQHLDFTAKLIQDSENASQVVARSFLGNGYTFEGKPDIHVADQSSMSVIAQNADNLYTFVEGSSQLKSFLNKLPKQNVSPKDVFKDTYSAQIKSIKSEPKKPGEDKFFAKETLNLIDAVRIAYDAIQVYSEPTLTKLEIDTVNSMFGVQLNSVKDEDKEMLEYMFAKGILNPEESTVLDLYQPLTNELALGLIYRIANPDARYTIKSQLSVTDSQLLDKGYSQIKANKSSSSSNIKKQVGEPAPIYNEEIAYVRLEEIFLKDKDGRAYSKSIPTKDGQTVPNLDYNPSTYAVENNLFGLYSEKYHKSKVDFSPDISMYYLGNIEINYKSDIDGTNRKVIWLKYKVPEGFNSSHATFDSGGTGAELPETVSGLSDKPGFYYISHEDKLDYLGAPDDFDLRKDTLDRIQSEGTLTFQYADGPTKSAKGHDAEDIYQLWKVLNPTSAERFEDGKLDPNTQDQLPPAIPGYDDMAEGNSSSLLSMDLYAETTDEAGAGSNPQQTDTGTTTTRTPTNIFSFAVEGIETVYFDNYKLFTSSGDKHVLNEEVLKKLEKDFKIQAVVQPELSDDKQISVLFSSQDKVGQTLTSFVEQNLRFSIPTDGTSLPVGLMYFKFDEGTSGERILISERALPMFDIKVFEDNSSTTKVLQNTKTGVYAVISEGTRTCIIGNEFIHYPDRVGMIEITDNGNYYNFDIIKKLFNYKNISKIDATITKDNLSIIENKVVTELDNAVMYYNGSKLDVSPMIYMEGNTPYLNLNTLGYGASYVIKTWTGKDGAEYSMLTEFVYEEMNELPTNNGGSGENTANPLSPTNPNSPNYVSKKPDLTQDSPTLVPMSLMNLREGDKPESNKKEPNGTGVAKVKNPVSKGHTLDKSVYGKYDKMLESHFSSIYGVNDDSRERIAKSNAMLHWSMYNAEHLPAQIETNYITSPYVVPKLTLFKDGKEYRPTPTDEVISGIYSEIEKISRITSLEDGESTGGTLPIGKYITDANYLNTMFVNQNRDWAYDKYKESICLNISNNATLGDVTFAFSNTKDGSPKLKLWTKTYFTGFGKEEVPLFAESHRWGDGSVESQSAYVYELGGKKWRGNGPHVIVDESNVQYVYLGLTSDPYKVDVDLNNIKSEMNVEDIEKAFPQNALFEGFKAPYSQYPYTAEMIAKEKVPFLEGNKQADELKLQFLNYANNPSSFVEANLDNNKIILLRYPDSTLRPHRMGEMDGANKLQVSKEPLNEAQLKKLKAKGNLEVYVQYNYLHGVTDLMYRRTGKTRQLEFAFPQLPYTRKINPVLDINTTIAKNLLSSRIYDSYIKKENGTYVTETNSTNMPVYLKDLKPGDVLLLNSGANPEYSEVVVVAEEPVSGKFIPVVGMFTGFNSGYSPMDVLISGRSNILLNQLLKHDIRLPGYTVPMVSLVDSESVQVASKKDFNTYMGFYSALSKGEIKNDNSQSSAYKSIFNESNKVFRDNILTSLNLSYNKDTVKEILVQSHYGANSHLEVYKYDKDWNNIGQTKKLEEDMYTKGKYAYLAHYDLYPYIEIEWIADYTTNPETNKNNGIYRISGVNLASGQNVGAFTSYTDYLKQDFDEMNNLYGKKKLWDKFYLSSGMLTADDLDAYINSQTPDMDRRNEATNASKYWASLTLSKVLLVVEVILILYGLLMLSVFGLCSFALGRLFLTKTKLVKILTAGRYQTPYDVPIKQNIIATLIYLALVTVVFYSGTWELLATITTAVSNIIKDFFEFFKGAIS